MKTLRVVIADDDGLTLMVLRKILTGLGHEIAGEAGDGEEAVAVVKTVRPDLCIFDIRMPKMEGLAAAKAVQTNRATPVIILSAHSEPGLGSEAASAGAHAYLVKPFTARELMARVAAHLSMHRRQLKIGGRFPDSKGLTDG